MMLDYRDIQKSPGQGSRLYGFCKDEKLDYLFTISGSREKRQKSRKKFAFIRRVFTRRGHDEGRCEPRCPERCS